MLDGEPLRGLPRLGPDLLPPNLALSPGERPRQVRLSAAGQRRLTCLEWRLDGRPLPARRLDGTAVDATLELPAPGRVTATLVDACGLRSRPTTLVVR